MANHYDSDDLDDDRGRGRGKPGGGGGGERGDRGAGGGGRGGFGRRKMCRFCAEPATAIDYKNPSLLKNFITDRGKMVPRRISGTCAKHQRAVALAVRRARMIALVPHTVTGK
jgi:small subunit ribosomal protein S18